MCPQNIETKELNLLRYAINNVDEEIAVCSIDGSIMYANDTLLLNHKLGSDYTDNTIFDLGISELGKDTWDSYLAQLRLNGGKARQHIVKVSKNRANSYYSIKTTIKNIDNKDTIWIFATNTTKKILQGKRIKELNYVMDAILNNIPVYLFVKDSANDFRYIYWNKAFEFFSKIPANKVIGNTDFDVFPNRADAEKFRKDDLTVLHKGTPIEFDEEYIDNNGEIRYVHTLKSLIHNDETDLPWLIGVSWDITDLKKNEKELTLARIKAEQSDKLKSAFLANMSHEIRTPLNAIVGFSRILCEEGSGENKQYQDIIEDNANLLLQLINDILDLSKIEAGTLEFVENVFELDDLFINIYEMNRHKVAKNVTLIYEKNENDIAIKCDRNRLLQVINNFLSNAIKFTSTGKIRFGYKITETEILFFVKDTGIGISQDNIEEVFNRFTKLNSFVQGTGLGLSICKTISDKMSGRVWVDSQENIGSTFNFAISYQDYHVETEKNNIVKQPDKELQDIDTKIKILVAEDIYSNYLLIENILGSKYELMHSIDGDDTLIKFEEFNPDIVLMDIKMPKKDGLEVTRLIRKSHKTPIIAITSNAYEADRKMALDSGCNYFITKPISADLLISIIKKYTKHQ